MLQHRPESCFQDYATQEYIYSSHDICLAEESDLANYLRKIYDDKYNDLANYLVC